MKKLSFLLLIFLFGCASSIYIQEGNPVYVGRSISYEHKLSVRTTFNSLQAIKYTKVLTDRNIIEVKNHIEVPDSVLCYIRAEPNKSWYFTWQGTDQKYKIIK